MTRPRSGKEAAAYERKVESGGDSEILTRLEAAGRLKRIPFEDRATMQKLAEPIMQAYAKEIDASGIQTALAGA